MSKIKIFVSHRVDQDNLVFENEIYTPVRCGAVYDKNPNPTMQGDNTGKNISDKRPYLGEITVQYWAWKNAEADYYGLCHYRRFLSFTDKRYPTDEKNQVIEKKLTESSFKKYGLDDVDNIRKQVEGYDAVVADYADISGMYTPKGARPTLYEHFSAYDKYLMDKKDIDLFLETIGKLYPKLKDTAKEYFNGNKFRGYNCFILKKDLFFKLCEMEFKILKALEDTGKIDFSHRSDLQSRTYGFFTEWIYGIFIFNLEKQQKKIKYTQLVFFENTANVPKIEPEKNAIPVVLETNSWLLPATVVAIKSVLNSAKSDEKYEFLLCHCEISKADQTKVCEYFDKFSNATVKFVDSKSATPVCYNGTYWDYEQKPQHLVYLLPWILKNYKKVVYLHSDVLVKSSLSELYKTDMEGMAIAATKDSLRISEHRQNPKLYKFRKYKLSMKDPYEYFSSACIVYDLERSRNEVTLEDSVRFSKSAYYHMDIMNRLYNGKVKFLDAKWNAFIDTASSIKLIAEYMPKALSDDLRKAKKEPAVIHYLSYPKPWQNPHIEMASDFWEMARETPFYERMVYNLIPQSPPPQPYYCPPPPPPQQSRFTRFMKAIIPPFLHPFFKKIKHIILRKK